jgi:hypothetical protein
MLTYAGIESKALALRTKFKQALQAADEKHADVC